MRAPFIRRSSPVACLFLLAASLACSRGANSATERLSARSAAPKPGFDWDHPESALTFGADDVAARVGSFSWTAAIEWMVSREGEDARRVRAVERHRVRQLATGEFEAAAEIDPDLGPGSVTGKEIVYVGGMTYARARYAPFRERPTDRGRDARRFRDESFTAPRSLARLLGSAFTLRPTGDAQAAGRAARRFSVALGSESEARAPIRKPGAAQVAGKSGFAPDDDTNLRRGFLEGLLPRSASGEVVLDAASGAPLLVHVSAAFSVSGDPKTVATVELLAQVKALGGEVGAIAAPKDALADERKAAGVADALETAGLKKVPEEKAAKKGRAEPEDQAEE